MADELSLCDIKSIAASVSTQAGLIVKSTGLIACQASHICDYVSFYLVAVWNGMNDSHVP